MAKLRQVLQLSVWSTHYTSVEFKDDTLRKFWEIEEAPTSDAALSLEEPNVLSHLKTNHSCTEEGIFVVPLPKCSDVKQIGKAYSQAVRRLLSLERSLNTKDMFQEFEFVMREYVDLAHAEVVLSENIEKPECQVCTCQCMWHIRVRALPPR